MIVEKIKSTFKVYKSTSKFEDTYNRVHIPIGREQALNIQIGTYSDTSSEIYLFLEDLFKMVNLFSERIEVPNKKVISDREGTSQLIRKNNSIEISKRYKRKDGTFTNSTSSPNICLIDNATREKFFKVVKEDGKIILGKYRDRYILTPQSGEVYETWSKSMDREYFRLSGINPRACRQHTIIEVNKSDRDEYDYLRLDLLKRLDFSVGTPLEKYLIRDKFKKCVYDIDGLFLQYLEDRVDAEKMIQVLSKISLSELKLLKESLN